MGDNEKAEYELIDEKDAEDSVVIIVKDRNAGNEKRQFRIDKIRINYYPIELHRCGAYVVREHNYDYKKGKVLPGYRAEFVRFDFYGNELAVFNLAEFSFDFRIDPHERYVVLEKGYAGSPDGIYDIVFKNLETMEDVFVLPVSEVWESYPGTIPGSSVGFHPGGWTRDGRYFWANFFGGAPVFGYIRIDSRIWTYEVFPAPPDVLGGDKLNLETGWLTVHPGNVWFGISELTEGEKAKRRARGIGTELYIHNLLTGERQFVASTTEPLHYFKPRWISDTELEYTLPDSEKKIYTIPPPTTFVVYKSNTPKDIVRILINSQGPVDLVVTDPDGLTITPKTIVPSDLEYLREIPGELYYSEMEKGIDGNPKDHIYSPKAKIGDYKISVIPGIYFSTTSTYSLEFSVDGQALTMVSGTPVTQIPPQGYTVRVE